MQPGPEPFDPMTIDRGDRYAVFDRFRARGPAHMGPGAFPGMAATQYLFSRSLVEAMLTHPDILHAPQGPYHEVRNQLTSNPVFALLTGSMLLSDPPRHGVLRRPVAGLFTAGRLAALEAEIAVLARVNADRCFKSAHFDLIRDFASPYAVGVLSTLLGFDIPDVAWLKSRTALIADALDFRGEFPLEAANRASIELRDFAASRMETPLPPASLMGVLLALEKDALLTREDVLNSCVLFLFAGQETVVDAIGNSALALARFPESAQELRGRPDLYPAAVEELLRFDSPVQFAVARIAARDVTIGATEIGSGQPVIGVLGSANHDPEWCEQPRTLDFHRRGKVHAPIFGSGIHACIGQHLARMELKSFLEVFYAGDRPHWRLELDRVERRRNVVFRGVTRAPVVVHPQDGARAGTTTPAPRG